MSNCYGNVIRNFNFSEFVSSGFVDPQTYDASINPTGAPTQKVNYTNGTGSLQGDSIHCKPYLLSAAPTTIDLTSLLDLNGGAVNFARVRELYVYNPDATAGHDVKVEQGASNPWAFVPATGSPGYARYGGGCFNISDPTSTGGGNGNVVGGSSKTITFDPGANTVTVYVLIFGSSVA